MPELDILKILQDCQKTLLIASFPADIDGIASAIILKKYLVSNGKDCIAICPDPITEIAKKKYNFLPYMDEILYAESNATLLNENIDAVILFDSSTLTQFYNPAKEEVFDLCKVKKVIHIDHHEDMGKIPADIKVIDVHACASVQVLLDQVVPLAYITPSLGELVFAALVEDTGNFVWNLQSSRPYNIAAHLIDIGVRTAPIIYQLILWKDKEYIETLKWMLTHIEYFDDIHTIMLCIPFEIKEKEKIDGEKFQKIKEIFELQIAKFIRGYDRGILIYEERKGYIYASFRANDVTNTVDIPVLLAKVGGKSGGHFNSASIKIDGVFEEIKEILQDLLHDALVK